MCVYIYIFINCFVFVCSSLRKEFVQAYLQYVFSDAVQELYSAFSSGFLKVCGGEILSLFQPSELMAMVVGNSNYNWEEMEKVGHRAVLQIFKTLTQHSYRCLVFFRDFVSLLFPPRMPPTRASSLHPTQQLRCFGRCFMSFPWRKKSSSYVSERQLHYGLC